MSSWKMGIKRVYQTIIKYIADIFLKMITTPFGEEKGPSAEEPPT